MKRLLAALLVLLLLPACSEIELASHVAKSVSPPSPQAQQGTFKIGNPYKVDGQWYYPKEQYTLVESGIASWYGPGFQGKKTANGETFDMNELTAAHRTLQMPSLVRVTNLDNGRSVIVRVNDRGPFKRGRIIDVSAKAAELLGFKNTGTAKVKLEVLPQESLQIAEAAKSGQVTKGYEIAANQGRYRTVAQPSPAAYDVASAGYPSQQPPEMSTASIRPVSAEPLTSPTGIPGIDRAVPGHLKGGEFYPDPVVTEMPILPHNIYIQAGSFTRPENAYGLAERLKSYRNAGVYTAMVGGQSYHRVRIGPIRNVEEADEILARIVADGHDKAIIVVE